MSPRLIVVSERDHRFVDLGDAPCGLGRAPENVIVVKDDMASRRHCVIERTALGFRVRDLKSFNGTYLNGERLTEEKTLKPWDSLRVGRTRVFYVEPGTPTGPPPPAAAMPDPDAHDDHGEATMGMTQPIALSPEARLAQALADPAIRQAVEDLLRRERGEVERQIGRRLRDESAPVTTPIAAGFAARARRIGPLDGGGDFYDVLVDDREPDTLFATVGTVSGQGTAASIAASAARHGMRGVLLAGTGELLDRLARVRDLLGQTLHPGTALSIVLARIQPGGRVRVAGLGGAGAIVLRNGHDIDLVRPIGRRDESATRLGAVDVTVGPEDRLLLASDGAASLRAPGGGEPFSESRLATAFRDAGALPPSECLGRIVDALVAHGAGTADRDATLALMTRG